MAEQQRFAFCPNCVENLIRFSFNGISFPSHLLIFAFSLPFHTYRATLPVCQPPNAIMYR